MSDHFRSTVFIVWLCCAGVVAAMRPVPEQSRVAQGKVVVKSSRNISTLLRTTGVLAIESIYPAIASDEIPLANWRRIRCTIGSEASIIRAIHELDPTAQTYQPRRLAVDAVPSPDPLTSQQWYLNAVNITPAWQITTGVNTVVVGVIDTGTELDHPDLHTQLWINPGEDINHDGTLTAADSNGVDDDHNGFVDDFIGYDFTDAAGFPTGGDDTVPDNNPSDEMGHGTAVASVVLAAANGTGIIGIAPSVKLMSLRAGNANGYLEEDDVAASLVYATENGADIVNMSFGDVVVAPILRDAVEYARARGVLLVASAGNSGTNITHYPSGYEAVLSVGASSQSNLRSSISTYGTTLDLLAPGEHILAGTLEGQWETTQGTSFSSPIVAGAAALLKSRDASLTASDIQTILCTTANDVSPAGWDIESGHGILNVGRALQTPRQLDARILSPADGSTIANGPVNVIGTVAGPRFVSWSLFYGSGADPQAWTSVVERQTTQRVRETLASVNVLPTDSAFTLRLVVRPAESAPYETRVTIGRDPSAPVIKRFSAHAAWVRNGWGWRVESETDDRTRATLIWRSGNRSGMREFSYVDQFHAIAISDAENLYAGDSLQIQAVNASGLTTTSNWLRAPTIQTVGGSWPLQELPDLSLPNGHLLKDEQDWNQNGQPEVMLNVFSDENSYDTLKLFERVGNDWESRITYVIQSNSGHIPQIAQTAVDVTGDHKKELMIRSYGTTRVLTPTTQVPYPYTNLIDPDTAQSYGAALADFDTTDRTSQMILRRGLTYENWNINWNNTGGYSTERTFVFTNPTRGEDGLGRPRFRTGLLSTSSQMCGMFGDTDGDIVLYRRVSDFQWNFMWRDSLGIGDATDYFAVGDINQDGRDEFVAGYHTAGQAVTERDAPRRKWVFYLYQLQGSTPVRKDSIIIDGAQDPRDFPAAVEMGDIDGNGDAEIFIVAYPNLFILDTDASSRWHVVYHTSPATSNTVGLFDINRNGRKELVYSDGDRFHFLEWQGDVTQRPLIPTGFIAEPMNTSSIRLSWAAVTGATHYRIGRADSTGTTPSVFTIVTGTNWIDTTAIDTLRGYNYQIAAIDSSKLVPLGFPSPFVAARPNRAPQFLSGQYESGGFVRLRFSEPIRSQSVSPTHFSTAQNITPASVMSSHSGTELLLRFEPLPAAGVYDLTIGDLRDMDNTPLSGTRTFQFTVAAPPARTFFLENAVFENGAVRVTFTLAYQPATITRTSFTIRPGVRIASVQFIDSLSVLLIPETATPVGIPGVVYEIVGDSSIHSLRYGGLPLDLDYAVRSINVPATSISDLLLYPNPVRFSAGESLTISGTPPGTVIGIFTVSGLKVLEWKVGGITSITTWDGRNQAGERVGAGIYLLYLSYEGNSQTTKVAVIE